MNNTQEVSPTTAFSMIQKGALLVDVREAGEVARKSFDVCDVMQIPLSEIKKRFKEIPVDRQAIIACNLGNRSMMALRFLTSQGYSKAVNMQNGIVRWEKDGLPLKKQPKQNAGAWLLQKLQRG